MVKRKRYIKKFPLLLIILLFATGCSGPGSGTDSKSYGSSSFSQSTPPKLEITDYPVALCINYPNHSVHQIIGLGFMEKAAELGYKNYSIEGLSEGSIDEMHEEWNRAVHDKDIRGIALWIADDTSAEYIQAFAGENRKMVVPFWDITQNNSTITKHIGANPISDEQQRADQMAGFAVRYLEEQGITHGSILILGSVHLITNPAYLFYYKMLEMETDYTALQPAIVREDMERAEQALRDNPDIIAVFDMLGTPNQGAMWEEACANVGHPSVIVFTTHCSKESLNELKSGKIAAISAYPNYEAGAVSMEMLDAIFRGKTFTGGEWQPSLPNYIVTADGEGPNGPDYYLDQFARAEAMFGAPSS